MKKIFFVIALLLISNIALASIPRQITVQGKLTDASDVPVASVSANFEFRIYDDLTAGTLVWSEIQNNVPLNKGLFNTALNPPSNVLFDKPYFLETWVNGNKLSPRVNITSAGYAFVAGGISGNLNMTNNNITDINYTYATAYYDRNDLTRYLDPSTTSVLNVLDLNGNLRMNGKDIVNANNIYASKIYDNDNNIYFCDPSSASNFSALNVSGYPVLTTATSFSGNVTGISSSLNLASNSVDSAKIVDGSINSTDVGFNYVAGLTQGSGITISGTAGKGWSPTVAITNPYINCPSQAIQTFNLSSGSVNCISISSGTVISIGAGNGLTSSTTDPITTSGILNVGAGTGITVAADTVSLDTTYTDNRYVNAAGDTMTGNLNMGGNNISNVNYVNATAYYDTNDVTKYLDPSMTSYLTTLDLRGNLLMNAYSIVNANNVTAKMFVDNDNTAYYCDPAGTSMFNALTVTGLSCTDCVALGSETTGDYVGNITAGSGISISGTPAEGWVPTITNTGDLSSTNEIQNVITNKGLQRDASNNFGIINCADGQIVKYNAASQWVCAADQAGGGWAVSGNYVYNNTSGVMVGIGTSAPSYKLDVNDSVSGGETAMRLLNPNDVANTKSSLFLQTGGGWNGYISMINGLTSGGGRLEFGVPSTGKFTFVNGNVGIGTNNPSYKLEVNGTAATPYIKDPKIDKGDNFATITNAQDINRNGFIDIYDLGLFTVPGVYACRNTDTCWNKRIGVDNLGNYIYTRDLDLDGNGQVSLYDFVNVSGKYEPIVTPYEKNLTLEKGSGYSPIDMSADINGDGFIDSADISLFFPKSGSVYGCANTSACWNKTLGVDNLGNYIYTRNLDIGGGTGGIPDGKVDLYDAVKILSQYEPRTYISATANGNFPAAEFTASDGSNPSAAIVGIRNSDVTPGEGDGLSIVAGGTASDFPLQVNNSGGTILEARGDGNVGVGLDSPSCALDVKGGSGNKSINAYYEWKGVTNVNHYGIYSLALYNDTGSEGGMLYGVYGEANNSKSTSPSAYAYGVYGLAKAKTFSYSVYGAAPTSGNLRVSVYGEGPTGGTQNWAGMFGGDVSIDGNVTMGWETVTNQCTGGSCTTITATCSAGKTVLSGGCAITGATGIKISIPSGSNGWSCYSEATTTAITAYAICARIK